MKFSGLALSSLVTLAAAAPAADPSLLVARQGKGGGAKSGGGGGGGCDIGFVFARGSTEPSPLVRSIHCFASWLIS